MNRRDFFKHAGLGAVVGVMVPGAVKADPVWGTSWTPADINATNFGFSIPANAIIMGVTVTYRHDGRAQRMTVKYRLGSGCYRYIQWRSKTPPLPNNLEGK